MPTIGGSIRTQVSIAPEDWAFIRENEINASLILREAIQAERAARTPEKALERLDAEQSKLDLERRRMQAQIQKQKIMLEQENALDREIIRNIKLYPQCPMPPPQVMSAIWGWVREHEEDFHAVLGKYTTSLTIVERIKTTWIANHYRIASASVASHEAKVSAEMKGGV